MRLSDCRKFKLPQDSHLLHYHPSQPVTTTGPQDHIDLYKRNIPRVDFGWLFHNLITELMMVLQQFWLQNLAVTNFDS